METVEDEEYEYAWDDLQKTSGVRKRWRMKNTNMHGMIYRRLVLEKLYGLYFGVSRIIVHVYVLILMMQLEAILDLFVTM